MKKPKKRSVNLKKQTTLREEAGRMLLDIGRMVFAGIVIVEILRGQIKWIDKDMLHDIIFIAGSAVVLVCFTFGLAMVTREIKAEKGAQRRRRKLASPTSPPIYKRLRGKRGKR